MTGSLLLTAVLIFGGNISDPAWAIKGSATWYDAPSMRDAAAGPALRSALGPGWRGTWVTVAHGGRFITVKLTDWCLCGHGRVIDLDDRAFARLAPLGRGVISVVVTGAATLPATDTTLTSPSLSSTWWGVAV